MLFEFTMNINRVYEFFSSYSNEFVDFFQVHIQPRRFLSCSFFFHVCFSLFFKVFNQLNIHLPLANFEKDSDHHPFSLLIKKAHKQFINSLKENCKLSFYGNAVNKIKNKALFCDTLVFFKVACSSKSGALLILWKSHILLFSFSFSFPCFCSVLGKQIYVSVKHILVFFASCTLFRSIAKACLQKHFFPQSDSNQQFENKNNFISK